MAQTQLSERLGSSGSVFQSDVGYNPQVSAFDLSRKLSTTISECAIVPLDVIRLLPGDKIDVSCRWLLDAMPQVVPPQTNYKIVFQLWYTYLHDLWKGAETFVTKGRDGSINMQIPSITYDGKYTDDKSLISDDANGYYVTVPHGLSSMLGLPPCRYSLADEHIDHTPSYLPYAESFDENDTTVPTTKYKSLSDPVNALIPFFYQKICRTMMPTNLLQSCKVWFPNDIANEDWRLAPDGSNVSADGHFVPMGFDMPDDGEYIANFVPHAGDDDAHDNCVNLWQTRYVQYADDLFTTAKPWLVRGEETTLDMDVSGLNLGLYDAVDYEDTAKKLCTLDGFSWDTISDADKEIYIRSVGIPFTKSRPGDGANWCTEDTDNSYRRMLGLDTRRTAPGSELESVLGDKRPGLAQAQTFLKSADRSSYPSVKYSNGSYGSFFVLKGEDVAHSLGISMSGSPRVSLTANTLRTLMAFSIKDEIDALTNGNYNSTIRSHFRVSPEHHDFTPMYVGGCVDYINFGSVMQTSASVDDKPLGTVAGVGGSSAGGYLGHINSLDYGYAMVIAYIQPEVTYTDGIEREWTDLTQDTLWFPEWSNLGFQPVLNKELKPTGVKADDDNLFGYQTRGIEYKQRRNKVAGLFGLHPEEDMYFSAYSQARMFDECPELCNEFTTAHPKNTRRDYLAFPELPSYRLQFASDVKAVRPLPFKSIPARFGM